MPWVIVNADTKKSHYKGRPRRKPRNWFEAAVRKAELAEFPWHCLRHTLASRLVMAGVDLGTVQELMRHRTIQMTCRYAHLAPRHNLEAVERLARFGSIPTGTRTGTSGFEPSGENEAAPAQAVAVQRVAPFAGP